MILGKRNDCALYNLGELIDNATIFQPWQLYNFKFSFCFMSFIFIFKTLLPFSVTLQCKEDGIIYFGIRQVSGLCIQYEKNEPLVFGDQYS